MRKNRTRSATLEWSTSIIVREFTEIEPVYRLRCERLLELVQIPVSKSQVEPNVFKLLHVNKCYSTTEQRGQRNSTLPSAMAGWFPNLSLDNIGAQV